MDVVGEILFEPRLRSDERHGAEVRVVLFSRVLPVENAEQQKGTCVKDKTVCVLFAQEDDGRSAIAIRLQGGGARNHKI